ncbi:MAG: hypothetical protein ACPHK3_04715 [Candidatus Poseidoniaceae archaeon]|jgi:hypothetical protein
MKGLRALLALSVVVLVLPMPASALCADAASCRILTASMLSILCMPLYIMGIIMLAFANTRPWVVIFGIMGVLGSAQAAFAVIPTRLDLLWLLAIHLVPAVLFLVVGIRAFRDRPKTMVIPIQAP